MAYAIQTSDGRFLDIHRGIGKGLGGIAGGDHTKSKFPKKRGGAASGHDIIDIRLQRDPVSRTNNATYEDEMDAEQDMQDAIKYMRSEMNRYKSRLAMLEAENEELGGKEASALGSMDRLAAGDVGGDLEGFMGRAGKLKSKVGKVRRRMSYNASLGRTILKAARVWRKVISGLSVVEV
jgi:hypothetical protein